MGANTGIFSVIAAEMGARVIAVDSSETCCEQLYEIAKSGGHSITPVTANIITPTPDLGFAAREYPGLMERAQGDLVLCLGLMHHLHISGRQSFDRIASLLKDLSTKFVLFEYVAQNDANVALLNSARPVSYDRDNVWDTLKNHFRSVDAMPSDRPTRELFLCER